MQLRRPDQTETFNRMLWEPTLKLQRATQAAILLYLGMGEPFENEQFTLMKNVASSGGKIDQSRQTGRPAR
jgi:hypothetical protein